MFTKTKAVTSYWNTVVENPGTPEETTRYMPNTNIPSIEEIRNRWCFGLPLSKEDGNVMTDEDIKGLLDAAIGEVEQRLGVFMKPTVIATNPHERGLVEGVDFEVEDHPYDYDAGQYRQYGFLPLRNKPILALHDFKMVLPNGNVIIDFMRDENTTKWIKLDKTGGHLNIVPYAGDPTLFAMMGGSQSGYPFMTGRLNANLPHMFYVDYTVGYGLWKIPSEVSQVIAKICAVNVLGLAGDAVMVGIASISTSLDGLSESTSLTASATSATYGAHIKQIQGEIDAFFKKGSARSYYKGFTMTGL